MSKDVKIERRRSSRVRNGLTVRIFNKQIRRPIPVIDLNRHGARLGVAALFKPEEIISFTMYLPNKNNIIDLTARVVRVVKVCPIWGFRKFEIGVEFLNMVKTQKEMLSKVVSYLIKKASSYNR